MRSIRPSWLIAGAIAGLAALGNSAPTQMIESRLSNIERRLDQMQSRVDSVEREQRVSSFNTAPRPEALQSSVLELQRQQNNVAQQVILLEQKMLELNKAIDQMTNEKRDAAKPKPSEAPKKRT